MKTSLGIWAFGPMATRFVPGGYQPQWAGETTVERVRRAVTGLGDLIDGYEFHYPQELSEENLDEVRKALGDHDIYCIATGLHLDPRFGRGGLTNPDPEVRGEALRVAVSGAELAREIDRREGAAQRLRPRRPVGRSETTTAEARIEVQARREAVDVVSVQCVADLIQVVLRQLLRIVELVAVDQIAEALDGVANTVDRRLVREVRLVAARDEPRRHRAERPDPE